MSEGQADQGANPPKMSSKKVRPFSAPRHQGLNSVGLKNKVAGRNNEYNSNKASRPHTGVPQPEYE